MIEELNEESSLLGESGQSWFDFFKQLCNPSQGTPNNAVLQGGSDDDTSRAQISVRTKELIIGLCLFGLVVTTGLASLYLIYTLIKADGEAYDYGTDSYVDDATSVALDQKTFSQSLWDSWRILGPVVVGLDVFFLVFAFFIDKLATPEDTFSIDNNFSANI